MKYEVLDSKGKVVKIIVAEQAFMDTNYPGANRALVEVAPVVSLDPVNLEVSPDSEILSALADINSKLDELLSRKV